MSTKRQIWIISLLIIIPLATLSALNLFKKKSPLPLPEISRARTSITEALQSNSGTYALNSVQQAQALYDSAMMHWQQENQKLYFFRDFNKARLFAVQAYEMALFSMEKTNAIETELREAVFGQIDRLQEQLNTYNTTYATFPLPEEYVNDLTQAKMLLTEGTYAYENEDYYLARKKLNTAETMITMVTTYTHQQLARYFENYPTWRKWIEESLTTSRKAHKACIIVDKYNRSCQLYKDGKLKKTFPIELGNNWVGDKKHQGDRSTPEGIYSVVKKKSGSQTRYHLALLINYPNEEDKKRFAEDLRQGRIQRNTQIGGLIEIHGQGGKGSDWTDGCVALTDQDMEQLFQATKEGTIVTIVGSRYPLEDIINK